MATETEFVPVWAPPTKAGGRIPQVKSGVSGGKAIDGDFPLDQVVIDRKDNRFKQRNLSHENSRVSSWHTCSLWSVCLDGDSKD